MTDTNQTALVTGANKGIGFETARQLAQRGFVVWLGCRDEGRGVAAAKELAKDGDVRFVRLDVTDVDSVRAAAADSRKRPARSTSWSTMPVSRSRATAFRARCRWK